MNMPKHVEVNTLYNTPVTWEQVVKDEDDCTSLFKPKLALPDWIDLLAPAGIVNNSTANALVRDIVYGEVCRCLCENPILSINALVSMLNNPATKYHTTVGVDFGRTDLVTLSNGDSFVAVHDATSTGKRLAKTKKELNALLNKTNVDETRLEKAKDIHQCAVDRYKRDTTRYLEIVSDELSRYTTVVFEDLDDIIADAIYHDDEAGCKRSIEHYGWMELYHLVLTKSAKKGNTVVTVDPYQTSQICSCCSYVNVDLRIQEKEWTCIDCLTTHNRDVNAAINIKKRYTKA